MNPSVQDKLYQELSTAVESSNNNDGDNKGITDTIISKSKTPHLHATLRERHRTTPSAHPSIIKDNAASDATIHGTIIPKNNVVFFDSRLIGRNPTIVPDIAMPSVRGRIDQDELRARVGTTASVGDRLPHRDPFGGGARRRPGTRVARNDVSVASSRLILDGTMSFEEVDECETWTDGPYCHGLGIRPKVPEIKFEPRR